MSELSKLPERHAMTDTTRPADAPIYRGMNRAALDAAYNNSAAVADSERWLEQWRRRSDEVRGTPGARLDIAYGPKERTRLDYFPSGRAGAPLFVFLHGGYWQRNAKDMFGFVAEGPLRRGIDVAIVGYTLAPAARLSEIVREVSDALTFLHGNAAVFGFERRALCVGGWSAGGHLAAVSCGHPAVRSALAISGIFDLEPIALTYVNDRLRLDAGEVAALSPARTLRPGMAPLAVAVGGDELPELQRQSTSFKGVADSLGVAIALTVLPGHHHYSILDELARADGALTRELVRLVAA
jgi:arylformamidase